MLKSALGAILYAMIVKQHVHSKRSGLSLCLAQMIIESWLYDLCVHHMRLLTSEGHASPTAERPRCFVFTVCHVVVPLQYWLGRAAASFSLSGHHTPA